MTKNKWILFTAQLPAVPSSLRVGVWRKLKNYGAVKVQNGVWILPRQPATGAFMERLAGYIRQNGAACQILLAENLEDAGEKDIQLQFEDDRNQEYAEFLEQSAQFISEIEKETALEKFTFAELEENEQNLVRLKQWLEKIQKRDYFQASLQQQADESMQMCVDKLHIYARQVYDREGIGLTGEEDSLLNAILIDDESLE